MIIDLYTIPFLLEFNNRIIDLVKKTLIKNKEKCETS